METLGFPSSLPQFQKFFPNDEACAKYLEALRWPEGFTCSCGHQGDPWRMTLAALSPSWRKVCATEALQGT